MSVYTVIGIEKIVPIYVGANKNTIGYVGNIPALWCGYLKPGQSFTPMYEGCSTTVDNLLFTVKNSSWI